jgi:erythromycin esterase
MEKVIATFLFYLSLVHMVDIYAQESDRLLSAVTKINSIEFKFGDNRDLKILDSLLINKRIVFLGEAAHGDGNTLKLKARVINYLTNNLDYSVLLLEENLYETEVMMRYFSLKKLDPDYVLMEGFRNNYYISSGLSELGEVLKRCTKTGKLAYVGGIDIVFNSWYASRMLEDLTSFGIAKKLLKRYGESLNSLLNLHDCADCDVKAFQTIHYFDANSFKTISEQIINSLKDSKFSKAPNRNLLLQTLRVNLEMVDWVTTRGTLSEKPSNEELLKFYAPRDKLMFSNLAWYLKKYPHSKIIVSTSSYHMSRGLSKYPTMVDYLSDSIQNQIAYFPFVYFDGVSGYSLGNKAVDKVDSVKRETLSLECKLKDFPYAFMNFSKLNLSQKQSLDRLILHPSKLLPIKAKWTESYDGVFFIKTMKPDVWKGLSSKDLEYLQKVLYRSKDG